MSPVKEVKVEVVEDPCKCEARLAFQKQTQATIQQLTAKNILPVVSGGGAFILNTLRHIKPQVFAPTVCFELLQRSALSIGSARFLDWSHSLTCLRE